MLKHYWHHHQFGLPYRLIDTAHLSYRQIYAGNRDSPERRISAGTGEH